MAKLQKVVYYTFSPITSASEQLRIIGPLKYEGVELIRGVSDGVVALDPIAEADLVVLHRNFPGSFREYLNVVEAAHAQGKPVLLDIDDDLLVLDLDHPDVLSSGTVFELVPILHALRAVDAVTVTTPILRETIAKQNDHVYVLPNYLDTEVWDFKPATSGDEQAKITLIYFGTATHQPDIDMIGGPLKKLAERYPGKLNFIFYGTNPPHEFSSIAEVNIYPIVTHDYQQFVRIIQEFEADIAFAPLRDTDFNHNKSSLKFLEYTVLGFPAVYSNVQPYVGIVEDGKTGFLADTAEEWLEKLSRLVESVDLRKTIVEQAQAEVKKKYLLQDHVNEWRRVYEEVMVRGVVEQLERTIDMNLIRHLAELFEIQAVHQAENTKIYQEKLANEIAQTEQLRHQAEMFSQENLKLAADLQYSQREVVDYATSTSWKITRPFRRVMRHLRRS